jgi:lipopolysaccharide export system permease protein
MTMSKGMTDLELMLYSGNMQDVPTTNPDELQRLYFDSTLIRVRGVGNQFQKTSLDTYKSDREMTVCEMQRAEDRARSEHEAARIDFQKTLASLQKSKAKVSKEALAENSNEPWDIGLGRLYCKAVTLVAPKIAQAQSVSPKPKQGIQRIPGRRILTPDAATTAGTNATDSSKKIPRSPATPTVSPQTASELAAIEALRLRLDDSAALMDAYSVEIHKKFALAVACFVFVLLGAPIALRFPRGGVGLTIGVSLLVFALYYICLIAGESLGKRGLMPPVISMWLANVIFAALALVLLSKMGREGSTARGGDMKEMFDSLRSWVRSKVGRKKPVIEPERAAA